MENKWTDVENNQIKIDKLSNSPSSDGFIGVTRKGIEIKASSFPDLMKMLKNGKFIHTWQKEKKRVKILMFQSKRKGTASAKIIIPSNCNSQILNTHIWPRFMSCKLWRRKEIRDRTRQEEKSTLWGSNSTYV